MDYKEDNGNLFKFAMIVSFLTGTVSYFICGRLLEWKAAKAGFYFLCFLSVMCACGAGLTDMTLTKYLRGSTKLAAFLFPFSSGAGSAAVIYFLTRQMNIAAAAAAVFSIAVCIITSAVLLGRYREDDL